MGRALPDVEFAFLLYDTGAVVKSPEYKISPDEVRGAMSESRSAPRILVIDPAIRMICHFGPIARPY
jgi:hypothetical protein